MLVFGGTASADPHGVVLAWTDAHGLVRDAPAVREEVTTILADVGVEVAWDELGTAVNPVTIVVTPSQPSGPGWNLKPTAMGVYLTGGRADAVFIFYHRVAAVVGVRAAAERLPTPRERRALARALGRVIVHELVHRLVRGSEHATTGVMRANLDRRALTGRRLALDPKSAAALHWVSRAPRNRR